MTNEPQAIEVEVVEVDGISQPARVEPGPAETSRQDWRQWQGRVRTLESRWWPLWVVLGIIALVLMLTVGVVIAVIVVIARLIRRVLGAVFR